MKLTMNCKATIERLYLSKGEGQDVYVQSPILPQHQINALRFIYNQYKKKNGGIILNDPQGYGKTVEVVLFLKAVKHLLKQPVLIICNENEVELWLGNFQKLTDLTEEIAVNPSNPYIKGKKVLIATWSEFVTFQPRNWSVLIIHHDEPKKELIKYSFNADFKIWVTSDDMRENLESFFTIYEWLHPNGDICLMRHNGTELEKQIHRDAFMQDIVIRGTGFESPEIRIQKIKRSPEQSEKNRRKTKNKDATGVKIKRSKKNVKEVNVTSEINTFKIEADALDENNDSMKSTTVDGRSSNNMNLTNSELKKGNSSVVRSGPIKRIKLGQNRVQNNGEHVSSSFIPVTRVKVEIMDEDACNGSTEPTKSADFIDQNVGDSDDKNEITNDNTKVENSENISSQNIKLHYAENDTNSLENDFQNAEDIDIESPSLLSFNRHNKKVIECNRRNSTTKDNKVNQTVLEKDVDDEDSIVKGDELADNVSSDLRVNSSDNDIKETRYNNDVEMCNDASEKTTENKKLANKSFDSLMDEMERKAMNKFKGSILDSLFKPFG